MKTLARVNGTYGLRLAALISLGLHDGTERHLSANDTEHFCLNGEILNTPGGRTIKDALTAAGCRSIHSYQHGQTHQTNPAPVAD
jgi:hypothetical protein